jgi:arylsulfatase A-like enzyme
VVVSWPGRLPAEATDRHLVSLLDVLPTCLGLAGVPLPDGIAGRMLPGTGADPPRDAVFAEYGADGPRLQLQDLPRLAALQREGDASPNPLLRWREAEGRPKMIRQGRYKYIYDPMDEIDELYDLEADPWELTNVARDPDQAAVCVRLRERLLDWSIQTEGGKPTPLYFDPMTGGNTTAPFIR